MNSQVFCGDDDVEDDCAPKPKCHYILFQADEELSDTGCCGDVKVEDDTAHQNPSVILYFFKLTGSGVKSNFSFFTLL